MKVSEVDLAKLKALVDKPDTATIISDVPDYVYHGGPGISNSGLNLLAKSPAHFKADKEARTNDAARKTPSKAFDLGTALHCAILEPNKISEMVALREKVDNRTKVGKEYNEAWSNENPGKIGLNAEELDNLQRCVDAVHAHAPARNLLQKGKSEQSAYWNWTVPVDGEEIPTLCRGRMDWLTDDGVIVDLKTTADADIDAFTKSITNYGYHRQQAWYQGGLGQILGVHCPFYFIVVENKAPPFGVRVMQLQQRAVDVAREELESYLNLYAKCLKSDTWPNYREVIEIVDIPHWYKTRKALV